MKIFIKFTFSLFLTLSIFWPGSSFARMPNDPNTTQWAFTDTGVYTAWDLATGSRKVVVAIIDNGFDYLHPDLIDNVWVNNDEMADNEIDDDHNGYIDDVYGWNFVPEDQNDDGAIDSNEEKGNNNPRPEVDNLTDSAKKQGVFNHATLVAGIIGASGNNGTDGEGINWQVRLMNIKVIDNSGEGSFIHLGEAIRYAVDNGANIINLSVVGAEQPEDLISAVHYANSKGVVMVAAAGNGMLQLNESAQYPICLDASQNKSLIIGVSAINAQHQVARFSNIGSDCIDITAPGVSISSTMRFSPTNGLSERYGGGWSGTSFATPFVSGAAALIKSLVPSWGPTEIYDALIKTVHHTPSPDEDAYANLYGAGLLQIDKAIEYAKENGQQLSVASAKNILTFDSTGDSTIFNWEQKKAEKSNQMALKGSMVVDSYVYGDQTYFVVVKSGKKDQKEISFYKKDWSLVRIIKVNFSGSVKIRVADVWGDEQTEIILWPTAPSREIFRVFNWQGQEIKKITAPKLHQGVSLDLYQTENVGKYKKWIRIKKV